MGRLETVDGDNWRELIASPVAVLVLGKTTCPACQAYAQELDALLDGEAAWPHVRFGKVLLDQRGLTAFKRENPWLAEVDTLPFTRIYRAGALWKEFPGGGIERLRRRLDGLAGSTGVGEAPAPKVG